MLNHNAYQDLATENFNCRLAVGVLHHRESNGAYLWYGEQYNGVEVKEPVAFERKARSEILTPEDNDTEGNGLQLKENQTTTRLDGYDNPSYTFTYDEISYGGNIFEGFPVQTADSPYKVWIWLDQVTDPDNPKVYWPTEADIIQFTPDADASYTFSGLQSITTLDLTDFDLSNIQKVAPMFIGLPALKTIYVNPDPAKRFRSANELTSAYNDVVFSSCRNLEGQAGTKYNYNPGTVYHRCGKAYTVVDKEDGYTPGFLSIRPDLRT